MRFSDFKDLLDDNPQLDSVLFENRGEMFLNKDLLPMMEYAALRRVSLGSESGVNLNFMHDGVLEGLVKYQFRTLLYSNFSISKFDFLRFV